MAFQDLLKDIADRVQSTASVKAVYGEPVTAEGRTIIPVAKVRWGFGGGGGTQGTEPELESEEATHPQPNEGGGGGGGVEVRPIGIIEMTGDGTVFTSFEDRRRLIRAVLLISLGGLFVWWRLKRTGK